MSDIYKDDDFVYVDPDTKTVVGRVEWKEDGTPVPKERPPREMKEKVFEQKSDAPVKDPKAKGPPRPAKPPRVRFYPWGSYLTMKKIYRLEGKKEGASEEYITLDTAVAKLQEEPFWNN